MIKIGFGNYAEHNKKRHYAHLKTSAHNTVFVLKIAMFLRARYLFRGSKHHDQTHD